MAADLAPGRPPTLIFIAGSNGAGKTTLTRVLERSGALRGVALVNPDAIARRLSPTRPEAFALEAGREAIRAVRRHLAARESMAVETTFSGRRGLRLLREAQSAGYRVRFTYVGLESAELAVQRVRQRAAAGGHSVPAEEVVRRYGRSLVNLKKALGVADSADVYDNSSRGRPAHLVLRAEQGRVVEARSVPGWLARAVGGLLAPGRVLGLGRSQGRGRGPSR